jgi:hypothetical protein
MPSAGMQCFVYLSGCIGTTGKTHLRPGRKTWSTSQFLKAPYLSARLLSTGSPKKKCGIVQSKFLRRGSTLWKGKEKKLGETILFYDFKITAAES